MLSFAAATDLDGPGRHVRATRRVCGLFRPAHHLARLRGDRRPPGTDRPQPRTVAVQLHALLCGGGGDRPRHRHSRWLCDRDARVSWSTCALDPHDARHAYPDQRSRAAALFGGQRGASADEPVCASSCLTAFTPSASICPTCISTPSASMSFCNGVHGRLQRMAGVPAHCPSSCQARRRPDRVSQHRRELDKLLPAVGHVLVDRHDQPLPLAAWHRPCLFGGETSGSTSAWSSCTRPRPRAPSPSCSWRRSPPSSSSWSSRDGWIGSGQFQSVFR